MGSILVFLPLLGHGIDAQQARPGQAQQPQPINAIEVLVNDEPISTFDINQRMRFVAAISGGIKSQEEFLKVREQVIRSMVDEKLQIQKAAEFDLIISNDELDQVFAARAQGVGQTPNQFESALLQIGASKETVTAQLAADIAWSRLTQGLLSSQSGVAEEQVESYIARQKANKGQAEFRIAEIVLQVNSPAQEESVKANANTLVKRIREGSTFADIASQLSSSPTSSQGGNMGWMTLDALSPEMADAVSATDLGGVTEPIRTPGAYVILNVQDRRRVMMADELDTEFDVAQLVLPNPLDDDPANVAALQADIDGLKANGFTCDESLKPIVDRHKLQTELFRTVSLRRLPQNLRDAISPLQTGEVSALLDLEQAHLALLICERRIPEIPEPDFDQVQSQLEQQRLAMAARRFLRDVRREAIIDYR